MADITLPAWSANIRIEGGYRKILVSNADKAAPLIPEEARPKSVDMKALEKGMTTQLHRIFPVPVNLSLWDVIQRNAGEMCWQTTSATIYSALLLLAGFVAAEAMKS